MTDQGQVGCTGIGSWPGTNMADALKITFAELPDFAYLPELPARGAYAGMVGRTTALLTGLAVDLVPAGWRLTDASGRDHRQAKATVRSDLDLLEEVGQGYAGRFKIAFAGPWTLAASMEKPKGDRVLADPGARRDLGQSLAAGLADLLGDVQRRLPAAELMLQLDEPLLPAVLSGTIATASGWAKHRSIPESEISEMISHLVRAVGDVPVAVHCCAARPPIGLLHAAGVGGLFVDVDQLGSSDWDSLGTAMEQGVLLGAGALPFDQDLSADQVAARVRQPVRVLGVDPAGVSLVLTPSCGLAGATYQTALRTVRTLRSAASLLAEQLAD